MKFKSSVDLPNSDEIIEILNQSLVDTLVLKLQAKFVHWNIKGAAFYSWHQLFDSIASNLDSGADLIAERVAQLGGETKGQFSSLEENTIPDLTTESFNGAHFIKEFSQRLSLLANGARNNIDKLIELGDQAGADIFIEITRGLDKDLWFLEAHLQ